MKHYNTAEQKLVNIVTPDQLERIAWDGHKLFKTIRSIRNGENRVNLEKLVGVKTFDRALKLKDAIDAGRATLVKRMPTDMGLVVKMGSLYQLSDAGHRHLKTLNDVFIKSFKTKKGMHKLVHEEHAIVKWARAMLMANKPIWVLKYKVQAQTPDMGTEIWKTYMHGANVSQLIAVKNVIKYLLKKEDPLKLDEDIDAMIARPESFLPDTPMRTEHTEAIAAMNHAFATALETAIVEDEDNNVEIDMDIDVSVDFEGDELTDNMLTELIGSHITSQDATDKRRGFIMQLISVARELETADTKVQQNTVKTLGSVIINVIQEDILFEEHIRPIIDHYTGNNVYGKGYDVVSVPLSTSEAIKDREDFPFEANVQRVSVLKFDSNVKLVDNVDGTRQIVKRQLRYDTRGSRIITFEESPEFSEFEAQKATNYVFEQMYFWKEFKKNVVLDALKNEEEHAKLTEDPQRYVEDKMEEHVFELYKQACKGKTTEQGFENFKKSAKGFYYRDFAHAG